MMAGSHMVLGAAAWALAAPLFGQGPDGPALGLAVAGSLLPDIDHPQSWAGRKFRVVSVPLAMLVGHRGVTHSALAVLAGVVFLVLYGAGHWATPLAVGYLSHLAGDALTPSGVPLLWPIKTRFSAGLVQTGGMAEILVVGLIAALAASLTGWPLLH